MAEHEEVLLGQVIAQGLLLRGLWARWATEAPDPAAAWNRQTIAKLIDSMKLARPPADAQEARLWEYAKNALREFGEQVDVRLRGVAAS